MKITKEFIEGYPTVRIADDEYCYTYGYYSNNSWVDDNRIILNRHLKGEDAKGQYVLIDLSNETEEILELGDNIFTVYTESVVFGEKFYYIKNNSELMCYNVGTKEITKICDVLRGFHFPHITADGKYINFAFYTPDGTGECYVVDVESKTYQKVFEYCFNGQFATANHMMICPTDKNKIFFAHEGDTFYISNRLWLYEKGRGCRCIAKQNLDENGNIADCFGHECWSADGNGLYFVKYPCSPKGPNGISYTDLNGNTKVGIYGKYPYWHVSTAPDGRLLGADCMSGEKSFVCVIDTKTRKEILIAKAGFNWSHPNHPHPSFSPNAKRIAYHDLQGDKLTVCFTDVENIITKD